MKKNVVITVRGLQRQVAEDEPVEVISAGTYLRKDDTHYFSYEEADEDGKLTKNRIKVTPSSVEMIKQGGITTQMIFVTGQIAQDANGNVNHSHLWEKLHITSSLHRWHFSIL